MKVSGQNPEETRGPSWKERIGVALPLLLLLFILSDIAITFNEPDIRFSGRVIDQNGDGIPYAVLRWSLESKGLRSPRTSSEWTCDENGKFRIYRRNVKGHTLIIESIMAPGYKDAIPPEEKIFRFNKGTEKSADGDGRHEFTLEKQ